MAQQTIRWRHHPALYITQALINPENGRRFELFEAERVFLSHAFAPNAQGDLPYKDILWSCIKKSGKSTFGAVCMLYTVICLGGRFAEAYVIANDYDQSQSRIFTATARIVEASTSIKAKITNDRITFSNGAFIQALASDYRGAAGVEPVFVIADELWGFTSESSQRLYEECCPTPTRHPSVRMIVSYAGFAGEKCVARESSQARPVWKGNRKGPLHAAWDDRVHQSRTDSALAKRKVDRGGEAVDSTVCVPSPVSKRVY
jgi:hypothetical protein